MKLRSLLNLTEQAPPSPMGGAPVAAPVVPPAGGLPDVPAPTDQAPSPDTAPTPEDPSEYDWTKDFREFEDTKNKAEADGKKKLLEKMNKLLLGKTIVANASRGYGQPKTDYTIESIKKISVEFWYKDYVVIVSDGNDKKYFLTPGVNIKIEQGGETAGEEQPAAGAPQEPEAGQGVPAAGQEAPNAAGPQTDVPTDAAPEAPAPQGQPPAPEQPAPAPEAPAPASAAPQGQPQPQAQPPQPEDPNAIPPKKKKKLAEWTVQHDLSTFLTEFMSNSVKDKSGNVNYVPYLKGSKVISESANCGKEKFLLEIPITHMVNPLDIREVKLSAVDSLRRFTRFGNYSKGSIEINKLGRLYILEYVKETGWIS